MVQDLAIQDVHRVGVVGSGTMGSQIAQLFATHDFMVNLTDISSEQLHSATTTIRQNLDQYFVKKGKISEDECAAILGRINAVPDLATALGDRQFVIEAVYEDIAVKKQVFKSLDALSPPTAVLASNTSGLSITSMAEQTSRPNLVVGMHFFNPVAVMKLVEVVKTKETSPTVVDLARQLADRLGKTSVTCNDTPSFIANRCYEGLLEQALWLVFEGMASPQDIDTAMKLGYNFPIGPMELQDRIGTWGLILHQPTTRWMPDLSPTGKARLRDMLDRRYLGRYSESIGKGIYDYWNEFIAPNT